MASFEGMPMSGPLDLVQSMSEYQPGASQPTHIHPGPGYATVIEGQITRRVYGPNPSTTVYNRGDSYHETPNEPHSAHNTAAGSTILSTTFLLPKGAQRIIFQPAPAPAQLPRTGDSGTAPLVLFGLGGVLLATGLALARFRRPA
jgi:LPXTG-motif cell wall-anchored protein